MFERAAARPLAWWIACAVLSCTAGCKGAPPVSVEAVKTEERRFLRPFLKGGVIGCGELVVEMTPNFFAMVSQPATDSRMHGFREEQHDGYKEKIWFNKIGDFSGRFVVLVGPSPDRTDDSTAADEPVRFTVISKVVLRIYEEERQMTFDVRATGTPLVMQQEAEGEVVELQDYSVSDGALRAVRALR